MVSRWRWEERIWIL